MNEYVTNITSSSILQFFYSTTGKGGLPVARYARKTITDLKISQGFSTKVDSFLSGANSVYVEQMYDAWQTDPKR